MSDSKIEKVSNEAEILSHLLTEIKKLNLALNPHEKESKTSNDTIVIIPEQDEQGRGGSVVFDKNDFNQMIYTKVIKVESMLNEMVERWLLINPVLNDVKKILSSYHKIDTMEADIASIKNELSSLNDKIKNHKTFSQFLKEKSEVSENITKVFKFLFYILVGMYLLFNISPGVGNLIKILSGGGN